MSFYKTDSRSSIHCLPSRTCYRSLLARKPIVYVHCMSVCVMTRNLGQSERHVPPVPIRMPECSSRLGGQRRFLTHICAARQNTRQHASLTFSTISHRLHKFILEIIYDLAKGTGVAKIQLAPSQSSTHTIVFNRNSLILIVTRESAFTFRKRQVRIMANAC